MASLKAHRDELIALYAHTKPGYVTPAPPPARPQTPPLVTADSMPEVKATPPTVKFRWWQPGDQLAGDTLAIDTETVAAGELGPGEPIPQMVLATATDGADGFYLLPADIGPFLDAHSGCRLVFHNVVFDVGVIEQVISQTGGNSMLRFVDANQVVCTLELERLLSLATRGMATVFPSLDSLAQKYCGMPVVKDAVDSDGDSIRMSFGKYLGKPREEFPADFLNYAAGDTTATWAVWQAQLLAVEHVAELATIAYGFPGANELRQAWATYGPLTLFVQVKAALVADAMSRQGVQFNADIRADIERTLASDKAAASKTLRESGMYVPYDPVAEAETLPTWEADGLPKKGPSIRTSIKKYLIERESELLANGTIDVPFSRTATGQISTDKEAQTAWLEQVVDPVLSAYVAYTRAEKWQSTYAQKMHADRVHPKWNHLLNSGRFSCTGAIALQTLPKCVTVAPERTTLRQCIIPGEGFVFLAADYSQIELVALAAAMEHQCKYGSGLANIIRSGADVHRTIAGHVLGKPVDAVTPEERKAAKPISFGLPGAMGKATLKRVAKANYHVELSEDEVLARMGAYKAIAPELNQHLQTNVNAGQRAAQVVGLANQSEGWRLLKVLAGDTTDNHGNKLSETEVAWLWGVAQLLKPHITGGKRDREQLAQELADNKPSLKLAQSVRKGITAELGCTMTGRVRARCTFSAARNNVFQGPTADGAILALWRIYRMGFRVAMFVHDELVIALRDDSKGHYHAQVIADVMREEMSRVLYGMPVGVEWYISRSFSKRDEFDPAAAQTNNQHASGMVKAAPVTIKGPAKRKKQADRPKGANRAALKEWQQKVADNDFDDGDLPF